MRIFTTSEKYDGDEKDWTIAGLLFVGKEASIQRLLPQAEVIYLHYSADNLEEYDARLDLKLPLISVIDKLTERVQAYSKIENIQVGLFRLEVEDFPERVFQEALLNALSHRDYQSNAVVYVKQYPDRIVGQGVDIIYKDMVSMGKPYQDIDHLMMQFRLQYLVQ